MPTLNSLPTELITMVAAELDRTDLLSLRLVCKDFQSKFDSHFLASFFQTRYHMISQASLENLYQVSKHPKYGLSVHSLGFCIGHLTENPNHSTMWPYSEENDTYDEDNSDDENNSDDEKNSDDENNSDDEKNSDDENNKPTLNLGAHTRYFNDQTYLKESGLDTAYLTQALSNLSNCKEICFSSTRQAWGFASQEKEIGVPIIRDFDWGIDSIEFVQRLLHITMVAVMISGLQLETLDLLSRRDRMAIPPNMLVWPKPSLNKVQFCLTSLVRLDLFIKVEGDLWAKNLMEFIGAFPKLEILDLSFTRSTGERQFYAIFKSLYIPRLRALTLLNVCCEEDDLTGLILRHKDTLKDISFASIDITGEGGRWEPVLSTIRDQLSVDDLILMNCWQSKKLLGVPNSEYGGISTIQFRGDWQAIIEAI